MAWAFCWDAYKFHKVWNSKTYAKIAFFGQKNQWKKLHFLCKKIDFYPIKIQIFFEDHKWNVIVKLTSAERLLIPIIILCLICNLKTYWKITVISCINCWPTHFCSVLVIVLVTSADVILPVHRILSSADFDHNCRQIWNCVARNFILKIIINNCSDIWIWSLIDWTMNN